MPNLVRKSEDMHSHEEAHIIFTMFGLIVLYLQVKCSLLREISM